MVSEPIGRIEFHSIVQESNDTLLTLGAAVENHNDMIERKHVSPNNFVGKYSRI